MGAISDLCQKQNISVFILICIAKRTTKNVCKLQLINPFMEVSLEAGLTVLQLYYYSSQTLDRTNVTTRHQLGHTILIVINVPALIRKYPLPL